MKLLKHNIGVFQNLVGLFLILFTAFYVNGIAVADEVRTKRSETRLPPITQPSAKAVSLIRELGMTDLGAALIEKLLEADTSAVRAGYLQATRHACTGPGLRHAADAVRPVTRG